MRVDLLSHNLGPAPVAFGAAFLCSSCDDQTENRLLNQPSSLDVNQCC